MFMLMCEDRDDVVMWMFPVVFFYNDNCKNVA